MNIKFEKGNWYFLDTPATSSFIRDRTLYRSFVVTNEKEKIFSLENKIDTLDIKKPFCVLDIFEKYKFYELTTNYHTILKVISVDKEKMGYIEFSDWYLTTTDIKKI